MGLQRLWRKARRSKTSALTLEFFAYTAMRSVCKKRCVFSPSMEREGDILWLVVLSLCHPSFGCQMGELRTGSSGWMY